MKKITFDKFMISFSVIYVILPIIIFFIGWLKLPIALIGTGLMGFGAYKLIKELSYKESVISFKENKKFFGILLIISILWVYVSGIGGLTYQNTDFWVRNPIYRDLATRSWPVFYNLNEESEYVRSLVGDSRVAFSYYYCWWLLPAMLSKIFHLGENMQNVLLFIWAVLGIYSLMYLLCRKFCKCTYIIPAIMVFFSGLDIIPYWFKEHALPDGEHIEWWNNYLFQYSSNTTQLFWVFNQSIPVWIITALLLQLDDSKYYAAVGALCFAYSPWATIGMVPIAIYGSFKYGGIKKAINGVNIAIPCVMALVFGLFFTASNRGGGDYGIIFAFHEYDWRMVLYDYIVFFLIEFGIYYIIIYREARQEKFYIVTLVELFVLPLIVIKDYNFNMRGSIPALFITMCFVIKFVLDNKDDKTKKKRLTALLLVLIVGAITPMSEIDRSFGETTRSGYKDEIVNGWVYSFGDMRTESDQLIETGRDQFFVYDYEDTAFFKYLGKK